MSTAFNLELAEHFGASSPLQAHLRPTILVTTMAGGRTGGTLTDRRAGRQADTGGQASGKVIECRDSTFGQD